MAINLEVFRKSLIYDVTAPKQVIDNELNEIKNINQVIGERQAGLIKIGWKYIKILFALVFVSLIMIFIFPVVTILIWLVIPIVFAIALFNYIQSWRQGRFSIQAYRYELTQKILEILSRDMDENAQISLKLDFSKNLELSVTASPTIATNSVRLAEVTTMMFLSCYQILNLARTISKTAEV
jgi:hypothetical protein